MDLMGEGALESWATAANPAIDYNSDKVTLPVLHLPASTFKGEGLLLRSLLSRLFAPGRRNESVDSMRRRIGIILAHLETRLIVLDGVAGAKKVSDKQAGNLSGTLLRLQAELGIQVVVTGCRTSLRAVEASGLPLACPEIG